MQQEYSLYDKAATLVSNYPNSHKVKFETPREETIGLLESFKAKFSPEILSELSDDALLSYLFLTADGNNNSLCYHLEFNTKLRRTFGSISGGSSYKFGLFQKQDDATWTTGSSKSPRTLSETEALQLGKQIRDNLVKACDIIKNRTLDTVEAYEKLDDDLNELMGKFASYAWVQKYLHLIFPDKFIGWYVQDWLKHILYGFGILPSEKYYGMNGQLTLIKQKTEYLSPDFQDICYSLFGEVRHFFRLGSSDSSEHYAQKWQAKRIIAIGWKEIGNLFSFVKNGSIDKEKLAEVLLKNYYHDDKKTATRKAGEIKAFYETSSSSVITVMDGSRLIGFVDDLSPYYYDDTESMAHQKTGEWHLAFDESDRLPEEEGNQTTCYEIKKPENLLYLYSKYYSLQERKSELPMTEETIPISFFTGYLSPYERNRILFGAPGTGKSFTLKTEAAELLGEGNEEDCERVTFHPDYSYANFVGTYKPVPKKTESGEDSITYEYVPGPFMRVYVKALRNSQTDTIKPFLLIIEEINRANVAAVFGDVFQLLDRGDDNVSEYPIQASEDIKAYLAKELGGRPDDYSKIRIPDNMFIWATMNSADQGVYPVDTAFKRRWDFTYLGIDDSEDGIKGKTVILGCGQYARVVEWNKLRKAINTELLTYKVNEDKLLGPYFIAKKSLPDGDIIDPVSFIRIFKNKVIMYLFEDAGKQRRPALFGGCEEASKNQYSKICKEFDEKGVFIFCEAISREFIEKPSEDVE